MFTSQSHVLCLGIEIHPINQYIQAPLCCAVTSFHAIHMSFLHVWMRALTAFILYICKTKTLVKQWASFHLFADVTLLKLHMKIQIVIGRKNICTKTHAALSAFDHTEMERSMQLYRLQKEKSFEKKWETPALWKSLNVWRFLLLTVWGLNCFDKREIPI